MDVMNDPSAAVEDLEGFQRKSAAIETVFTLAVIFVGVLQITTPSGWLRVGAFVVIGLLVVLALVLGGENLWNQLRKEMFGSN